MMKRKCIAIQVYETAMYLNFFLQCYVLLRTCNTLQLYCSHPGVDSHDGEREGDIGMTAHEGSLLVELFEELVELFEELELLEGGSGSSGVVRFFFLDGRFLRRPGFQGEFRRRRG